MHEDSIAQLFEVVKLGENVKPMFYVFWRDSHTLKSIEPVARLARTDTPITFNRDSFDETGTWVVQPEIKLFHYGFIRDFEKWRDKAKFLQTSLHGSYDAVWLESKTAIYGMVNKLLTFHGTHPKHAHDWLRAHGYQI